MEFEQNTTDKSAELSDAQRLLAATKKIELEPIHSDVAPEALPSGTPSDTFGTPIALPTIPSESEDTSTYQPSTASATPHSPFAVSSSPRAALLALILFAAVTGMVVYILVR